MNFQIVFYYYSIFLLSLLISVKSDYIYDDNNGNYLSYSSELISPSTIISTTTPAIMTKMMRKRKKLKSKKLLKSKLRNKEFFFKSDSFYKKIQSILYISNTLF